MPVQLAHEANSLGMIAPVSDRINARRRQGFFSGVRRWGENHPAV
jgi:hypothetical protein